ncbi:MAG: Uma2 family endonuclease [Oscillospiraceae bacterium]
MAVPENKKKYTVEEFFKLTEESTERMELIDGEIYNLAAPSRIHQMLVGNFHYVIKDYIRKNKGKCNVMIAPFDVVLWDNVVQPDVMVICDPSKLDDKRCNGAPDWIIEVTSSNYQNDYADKLRLYQNTGVREYWIVDPERKMVTVLFFEKKPANFMLYQFSDTIPVNIYQDAPVQLTINIEELLNL